MIKIEMLPNNEASACGITVKSRKTGSPIHKLCRDLIAQGYAEHDIAMIYRGDRLIFRPARLSFWAATDTTEGDGYSPRFVKHKPFEADCWD